MRRWGHFVYKWRRALQKDLHWSATLLLHTRKTLTFALTFFFLTIVRWAVDFL